MFRQGLLVLGSTTFPVVSALHRINDFKDVAVLLTFVFLSVSINAIVVAF